MGRGLGLAAAVLILVLAGCSSKRNADECARKCSPYKHHLAYYKWDGDVPDGWYCSCDLTRVICRVDAGSCLPGQPTK